MCRFSVAILFCAAHAAAGPNTEAPRLTGLQLDGRIDAAWAAAPVSDDFSERRPTQGATPPVATRFRAAIDDEALWLLVECDDTPGGVTALTRTRDTVEMFSDDAVSVKIDAHSDRRTTLGFATNPLGAQLDYRAIQDGDFRVEVDRLWEVAVERRDDGWTAEYRIPFAALGLEAHALPPSIGLNWSRDHARRNATYDWSLMAPPYSPVSASLYGTLRLLSARTEDAPEPAGGALVATPFFTAGLREGESSANGGVDAQLSTANTHLSLTINTDFAQVDLDDQVVQLDRFGLFIPEKREFFLAHAETYDVGRSGVFQPLYTRRIGSGDAALLGGLAVSSRHRAEEGPAVRVALLQATTRPTATQPWTSSLAARAELVGTGRSQWSSGLIATHRHGEDPDDHNVVVGLDATYRGPAPLVVRAALLGSMTGGSAGSPGVAVGLGEEELAVAPALHLRVVGRDSLVQPLLDYAFVHRSFRADLGFIERGDVHDVTLGVNVEPRIQAGGLEKATITVTGEGAASGAATDLLDWAARLDASLTWDAGTWFAVGGGYRSDTVRRGFVVGPREVAAGSYEGAFASVTLSSPSTLALYGSLTADARAYFGGWLVGGNTSATWKPLDRVRLELACDVHEALFETGEDFTTVVANGRLSLGLTTTLSLDLFTGYGLLDEILRAQARLRFEVLPGSHLYVVYEVLDDEELSHTLLAKLALRVDAW